jgi:phage I-like protein
VIDKYLAEIAKTGGFWYRLLPYMEFQDPRYGKVSLTKELAQKIEENFKNGVPSYELSLDIEHGKDANHPGAYGKITKVEARDDGLWVYSEPDEEGVELIKRKKFKYMSATYAEKYMDKKTGKDAGPVLRGAALTNMPAVPDMEQIVYFSEFEKEEEIGMEFKDLFEKAQKELSDLRAEKDKKEKELSETLASVNKELSEARTRLEALEKEKKEAEEKLFSEKVNNWAKGWTDKGVKPAVLEKIKPRVKKEEDMKLFEDILESTEKVKLGQSGRGESAGENETYVKLAGDIAGRVNPK